MILSKRELWAMAWRFVIVAVPLIAIIAVVPLLVLINYERGQARKFHDEVVSVAILNCQEIQELKYQNRKEALQDYQRRHIVYRVLGIEKTVETERIFAQGRDNTLAANRGRPVPCRKISLSERLLEER